MPFLSVNFLGMIKHLLKHNALTVVFQPIANLFTGEIYGYEVLGRLAQNFPGLSGSVPPGPLILLDYAAQNDCLLELDCIWRNIAIQRITELSPSTEIKFFINIDTRVIEDPLFNPDYVISSLKHADQVLDRLVLEFTERGSILQKSIVEQLVNKFRQQGLQIALDDMGAGYASLTALLRLRPGMIKIDHDIVRGLAHDCMRQYLVQALSDFCRRSKIDLIAEGIEDKDDLAALMRVGVKLGQGFFIGMPKSNPQPLGFEIISMLRRMAVQVWPSMASAVQLAEIAAQYQYRKWHLTEELC